MGNMDMDRVRTLVIISVSILAGSFVFSYVQARLMVVATQRTSQNMRTAINQKIDRMPLSYFDRISHGDTLSRVTNDVDTLSQTLNNSVSSIMTGVIMLVGSAVMMFVTELAHGARGYRGGHRGIHAHRRHHGCQPEVLCGAAESAR